VARRVGPWSDPAHRAITAELVRLCLPHTGDRPELACPLRDGQLVR